MPQNKLPVNGMSERRAFASPDLKAEEKGNIIEGHAAVFDQMVNMYDCWNETIARGAFDKTDFTDVVLSVNHDLRKIPAARSRNNKASSTLQLQVDDVGLAIRASLDLEKNCESQALYSSIGRGDMNGMSFIFTVRSCDWTGLDTDMPTRTITDIGMVYEVSVVSFPAYDGTDISARDALELESAKKVLENARAAAGVVTLAEQRDQTKPDLEFERLKAQIMLNI